MTCWPVPTYIADPFGAPEVGERPSAPKKEGSNYETILTLEPSAATRVETGSKPSAATRVETGSNPPAATRDASTSQSIEKLSKIMPGSVSDESGDRQPPEISRFATLTREDSDEVYTSPKEGTLSGSSTSTAEQ